MRRSSITAVLVLMLVLGTIATSWAVEPAVAVREAVARLQSSDAWTREVAAWSLRSLAPASKEAVPALARALSDTSPGVRGAAATSLGMLGPEAREAVPALKESLKTRDWSGVVQALSAWALGRIGPEASAATPALIVNLTKESLPIPRYEAARALGEIGPGAKDAVPALQAALQDSNGFVRVGAATALWQVEQDKRGLPLLIGALTDQTIVGARIVADSLALWGEGAAAALPTLRQTLKDPAGCARVAAARAIWRIGQDKSGVPALLGALADDSLEVRQTAAETLRLIEGAKPEPRVTEALTAYDAALANPPFKAKQPLVFEVEDWTGPTEAIVKDQDSATKWKWATRDSRWTKNTVLVSPTVPKDRATPEEGAPPLRTHLTGIPKGTYAVTIAYTRPLALSLDGGKTWQKFDSQPKIGDFEITDGTFDLWVDDRYADSNSTGGSYYDTLTFTPVRKLQPWNGKGWATTRVREKLGRSVEATVLAQGGVYLNWRLLRDDPKSIGFDVYRREGDGKSAKLNVQPITQTTDYTDSTAQLGKEYEYRVLPAGQKADRVANTAVRITPTATAEPYTSIKLQGDYSIQKIGVGDLDGDGRMDYVVKQPDENIDPWYLVWHRSPTTHKLEAYNADGRFMWRYDMGWGVELGVWFSPYVIYDFDGDGRAEVACKSSEGDTRDADGKVTAGAEYLTIVDGLTGKVRCRAPWPTRDGFTGESAHNYAARNEMGVAFLDGKTPCLVVERGTYGLQKIVTYQLRGNRLDQLFYWDNTALGSDFQGQGAHTMHAADMDGDGCDELLVGSWVMDHNATPLWSTGFGHPDNCYVGEIDPLHPGLEIFFNIEPAHKQGGVCLVEAKTGQVLWGRKEQTYHVGAGVASDIDPAYPGLECWASEDGKGDPKGQSYNGNPPRWIYSAQGELLGQERQVPPFGLCGAYWDEDPQRELIQSSQVRDYQGGVQFSGLKGSVMLVADLTGDWREEIVTVLPGELRVYRTMVAATDRRVTLLDDPIYRLDIAMESMGYSALPTTSHWLGAGATTLKLSGPETGLVPATANACTATIVAPTGQATTGMLRLTAEGGASIEPTSLLVSVSPGQVARFPFVVRTPNPPPLAGKAAVTVTATLELAVGKSVQTKAALPMVDAPLSGVPLVEAENFFEQSGGEVHLRTDKPGASGGKAFSHWDSKGHRLGWQMDVPQAGRYALVFRYGCGNESDRSLFVDGKAVPGAERLRFPPSTPTSAGEWSHFVVRGSDGKPVALDLSAGTHRIVMENLAGQPLNLDTIALVALP